MNNAVTVEQLFSERVFCVPDYQRGYAWEPSHRDEFIQDIELLADGREHYTGTIVLHRQHSARAEDDEGKTYAVFDVVDGQQRLTSTVLFLDALRCEFEQLAGRAKFAEGVRKSYIAATDLNGQPLFRLRLNRDCREFWEDVVMAQLPCPIPPKILSHQRLLDGQREFRSYLEEKKAQQGGDWPDWALRMYRKVTQQLRFSLYEVGSVADVGVIFEVMNDRGKQLSELEKVKNYLLYLSSKLDMAGHDLANKVNHAWAAIFENLMQAGLASSEKEDQLLRAHWLAKYDHDARNWKGAKSVKSRFSLAAWVGKHKELLDQLLEYTKTLRDAAVAYADAASPSRAQSFGSFGIQADAARRASERLLRTDVLAPFLPLLVSVRLAFPHDAEKYRMTAEFCELFAFRVYKVALKRSNTGQTTLISFANQLLNRMVGFDKMMSSLYGALLYYSNDSEFAELLESRTDWYDWRPIRYFLYEYEGHLAGKNAVKVTWAEIDGRDLAKTVEHILPQSAEDPYWKRQFKRGAREKWTHDIGNLVLTSHNSTYWCHSFPVKKGVPGQEKPCYVTSNLFQERALGEFDDWGPEQVEARRRLLLDWALVRWAVPAQYQVDEIDGEDGDEEEE